jgi:hypothetical protein
MSEAEKMFNDWADKIIEKEKDKDIKSPESCHRFFTECERYFKGK